jgi:gliding motility-associated-like protein
VTLTNTHSPGASFSKGTTQVTYTAEDDYGNTSSCSFNVTVIDDTDPVINGCPSNIVVNANASCQAAVNWTAPTVSDNCAGPFTLTTTKSPGTLFDLGTTTVTYTATDVAGNTSTCSFTVTVQDNTAPIITGCPSNIVVNANGSCQATVNWTPPTASDNCPGVVTLTTTKNPGTIFELGTTPVTYTATDAAGRTSTCTFNVTVQDVTNPVITGCPSNIVVNANASCQATVNWTAPTASDNCPGIVTLTPTKNPGTIFNLGTTTVTYTATDAAGRTSTCSFTVTVQDNTAPVITGCPSDIVVNANGSCQATVNWTEPTASDNCPGVVTLTTTKNPGTIFGLGTTPVTYTATDAAGRTSTCSFNVTVQDVTNPVITGCPSNIVVNANASCQATVNWTAPTASDNCPGIVTLTPTKNPGTIFNLGTTTVTYTATDAAGRTSTCSFNVTVQDATNPVITGCPSNIVVNANASCQATVNWTAPTASDSCPGTVTLTSTKSPGSVFSLGTTPVTYTATDAAGRTSTCTFNVTVQDQIKPVLSGCPSDIVVNANASCQATVTWTPPTTSDNCAGIVSLTSTRNPGTVFSKGTTVVTYTARDAANNISTCSFNVTVQDITPPVILGCPSNIVVNANGSCQATVNWTAPTRSDNCAGPIALTATKNPGSTFSLGTTVVTYTATDVSGNTSTCSFNVTVQDNTKPVIVNCPGNIVASADAACQATVNWTQPSASDNCGSPINLTSSKAPGSTFTLGTTTVTYTAVDAAGNSATCSFNVVVTDGTAPVLTGCTDIRVAAGGSCETPVTWTPPAASDCSTINVTSSHNSGGMFAVGTTEVTYTATDAVGNSASCKFNVIVEDRSAPVFQGCPNIISVDIQNDCDSPVSWTEPTALDNCGTATITKSHIPGSIFPIGVTEVKYTATDGYGNVSVCQFNVSVKLKTLPVITACPEDIHLKSDEVGEARVDWVPPQATAVCSDVIVTASHQPGSIFGVGTTRVEYQAEDAFGNKANCHFNVVVTQQEIDIDISQVVTPDGNGHNDEWTVTNIEKFRDNRVVIVDRWGSVIYTATGYNNENVAWRGINQNGAMVPMGTYFYTISIRYGKSAVEKSGFIELIR